ncbi:MAG: MarC family protein [Nitrospirae bacterium]|jgi:multiple antibiotic resistance protein|nr:MarC family protein [Nitrospirota bacterium]
MENIIKILPNTFIPLFVATNIFMLLPVFISLTKEMSKVKRKIVVRDSILTAIIVSFLFIGLGEFIFKTLGITSDDFKIAGGIVLLIFAVRDLVHSGEDKIKPDIKVGVVPIGVPLIVGPAVLTNILLLVDHYGIMPTIISLILNLFIVWITLINAEKLTNIIGKGGIIGIAKVMALLLAAIAIMMIRIGIQNTFKFGA